MASFVVLIASAGRTALVDFAAKAEMVRIGTKHHKPPAPRVRRVGPLTPIPADASSEVAVGRPACALPRLSTTVADPDGDGHGRIAAAGVPTFHDWQAFSRDRSVGSVRAGDERAELCGVTRLWPAVLASDRFTSR